MKGTLLIPLMALLLLLTACRGSPPTLQAGTLVDPPLEVPPFTLVDQEGRPFTQEDLKGKVSLLFFGYTHCPDVCPLTLAIWTRVARDLGPQAEQVRFVFVTVDPERDTPERLREYLSMFSPGFIGLTGERPALERLYRPLGVYAERLEEQSASGYLMAHTASTLLLDGEGRVRALFPFGTEAGAMAQDVRRFLGR